MFDIHLVSVLASTLVMMAVGSIWYAPAVFGRIWMQATGLTEEKISEKGMVTRIMLGGVVQFGILYVLAHLLSFAEVVPGAGPIDIAVGAALLVSLVLASHVLWERRPPLYFWVNAGYVFVSFIGSAVIITYWPW